MTQIPWDLFKQDLPHLNEEDTGYVTLCLHIILWHLVLGALPVTQHGFAVVYPCCMCCFHAVILFIYSCTQGPSCSLCHFVEKESSRSSWPTIT